MSDIIRIDSSMVRLIEELREKEIKFQNELYEDLLNSDDEYIKQHSLIYKKKVEETKEKDYKEMLKDALLYAIISFERNEK